MASDPQHVHRLPTAPPTRKSGQIPVVRQVADELRLLWVGEAPTPSLDPSTQAGTSWTCTLEVARDLRRATAILQDGDVDVVITRLTLPDIFGFDGVIALHVAARQTPIVVVAEPEDEQFAMQALTLGAQEYLIEGSFRSCDLRWAVERAMERKALEHRLEELTQLDTATGLRNRALLRDRFCHLLVRARREQQPFVFAIIALLGQDRPAPTGSDFDQAMTVLSEELALQVRASDTLGRLAYDRFGLLLEHLSADSLNSILERLVQPLRPLCPPGTRLQVSYASFPLDGETVDGLMQVAQLRQQR